MELGAGWWVSQGFEKFVPFVFFFNKRSSTFVTYCLIYMKNALQFISYSNKNNVYCKIFHPKLSVAA